MQRSKILKPLSTIALSSIVSFSHVSFAAEKRQVQQVLETQSIQVQNQMPDKFRPVSPSLTEAQKALASPQAPTDQSLFEQMGGVSDGGGNAVGGTLFDFYENEGAVQMSVQQLLALEPQAQQLIQNLNIQVPRLWHVTGNSFGNVLIRSLTKKKIYLDKKRISSQGCLNQSMVSTAEQVAVACQSDSELRINEQWMKTADSKNRSGLILHEMILGWLRSELKDKLDKKVLEQKVRELVRVIFTPNADIAKGIREITGARAFGAKDYALLTKLPEQMTNIYETFCKDPKQGPVNVIPEFFADKFLRSQLHPKVNGMQILSDWLNESGYHRPEEVKSVLANAKDDCGILALDKAPIRKPLAGDVVALCKTGADDAIKSIVDAYNVEDDLLVQEKPWEILRYTKDVLNVSLGCTQTAAESAETLPKIANYAKWRLKQEYGIEISFVRSLALTKENFLTKSFSK